ncbi:hypothetical protein D3C78_396590 [compost metagenome]
MEVPEGPDPGGDKQQHQDEMAGEHIRQLGDGGFVIQRMILQPHDLGEARLFDGVADPDLQRRIRVDGAGEDGIPRLLEQGQLLTGQHGFVEAGLPQSDDAVCRQGSTGQHPDPVPHPQRLGGHLVLAICVDAGGHDGHQARQVGA